MGKVNETQGKCRDLGFCESTFVVTEQTNSVTRTLSLTSEVNWLAMNTIRCLNVSLTRDRKSICVKLTFAC